MGAMPMIMAKAVISTGRNLTKPASMAAATGSASCSSRSRAKLITSTLFAVATHSLTRLVARDRVTSFLRAPFVRFEEDSTAGEVEEQSRGTGMQKALGQLLGCPFCLGPWVAAGFLAVHAVAPRQARWLGTVFALSAASSFLHRAYEWLGAGLHRLGVGPGDVVAFQLPNWAEAAATFYGVSALGATLV